MPKYRIVSEPDHTMDRRHPRGKELPWDYDRLTTVVTAASFHDAAYRCGFTKPQHGGRRIIAIEEIHPGLDISDDQITTALIKPEGEWTSEPRFDPETYTDTQVYGDGDFVWEVQKVADALRDTGLVPGLNLSLVSGDGYIDYAMVEIYDLTRANYRAVGSEIKHLTEDRDASGWAGILAIARALINTSNALH